MGDKSKIEWTDATWNPVTGCTKVSEGCRFCYAERQFPRVYGKDRKFNDVRCHEDRLDQPLRWRKPRRVFVNSMSDLFHEDIPLEFIGRVFSVMEQAKHHIFQILTKRPARMLKVLMGNPPTLLPNVWLGVSVEDQKTADERIPLLLETPAAVRFLSCEPLLGPVDLLHYMTLTGASTAGPFRDALGRKRGGGGVGGQMMTSVPSGDIGWVIVGGESGPRARYCDLDYIRRILDDCAYAKVPCFVKQLGAKPVQPKDGAAVQRSVNERYKGSGWEHLYLHDKKGGLMAEWPEDLRVQEYPS